MTTARLCDLLRHPIVVAPMAGGPSTPTLVVAAANAGALGFLAAGYKSTEAMAAEISAVRAATTKAFGVNVFVPGTPTTDPVAMSTYLESLTDDVEALGATLGRRAWDDDAWESKTAALLADPPPIVSFTFGCPPPELIAVFRDAGSTVAVTVTHPNEAIVAATAGADCLCVQGTEAGAHRGTFTNDDQPVQGHELLTLIDEIAHVTDLPQIAAGGVMDADAVAAVLSAGAMAAQCGTAFLRCPESGAHPVYKAALGDARFTSTALTRSFSGRPARGLVNQFMRDHPATPPAYPEINNATRPLRAAAMLAGDADRMSLWAGSGFQKATTLPVAEVVSRLCP